MRKLPFILFSILFAAMAVMLLNKNNQIDSGRVERKVLPNISVIGLHDQTPWKQEHLRDRVTLINFFASWCTPCEAEMPELMALKLAYPSLHIEGVVWNDDSETIITWLKKHGDPFDALWYDRNGSATISLGIRGIPESLIVDKSGTILYRLSGPITQAIRNNEIDAIIEAALAEGNHAQ